MSYKYVGGDSYRPVGPLEFEPDGRHFHSRPLSRAATLPPWLAELAAEAEIDVDRIPAPRYTTANTQTDRTSTVRQIYDLISESGETANLPSGPMTAYEMGRLARAAGIPIGDARSDDADFREAVRHEAAHAACGYALGWDVEYVDARAGKTAVHAPDIMSQDINDKHLQFSVIAASAKAFTGSYCDQPFEDDRYQVRSKGHIDFETAQKKAELVAADPWARGIYNRLVDALLAGSGRLEGDELQRVLEAE